ncbi:MAG: prepilin-type N-terminal cleavage/methylation domain-containing protein [Burkholderiales bacterium]|jgi:prepilin-type N-terminal cleavage/methylation domain-containing protein|nr:prepilin-type N-terminal cleavage/methylation domain-containing protein [Burkholderiales bacterium]
MHTKSKLQSGFTLAEMAIVIVLGGILLAAGLMAGRGQISRTQAQDVIQIANDLQTGALAFKQRYGYLPGDWIFVANQIQGVAAGGTGGTTGNGLIEGTLDAVTGVATALNEIGQAPVQLYQASLIGKMGTATTARLQSQFGPVHMAGAAANATAAYIAANPSVLNVIVFYNLPCEVVLDVDRALDNGVATNGKVMVDAATCNGGATAVRTFIPL